MCADRPRAVPAGGGSEDQGWRGGDRGEGGDVRGGHLHLLEMRYDSRFDLYVCFIVTSALFCRAILYRSPFLFLFLNPSLGMFFLDFFFCRMI